MKLLRIYSGEKNFLLNPIFKNIFLGLRNHLPGLGRKREKKEKKNEKKKNEGYYMFYKFTSVQGLHKYLKSLVHVNTVRL